MVVQVARRVLRIQNIGLRAKHVTLTCNLPELLHVHAVGDLRFSRETPWGYLLGHLN
jgi:hypothetical protein